MEGTHQPLRILGLPLPQFQAGPCGQRGGQRGRQKGSHKIQHCRAVSGYQ
jgi:hypothetical protein